MSVRVLTEIVKGPLCIPASFPVTGGIDTSAPREPCQQPMRVNGQMEDDSLREFKIIIFLL